MRDRYLHKSQGYLWILSIAVITNMLFHLTIITLVWGIFKKSGKTLKEAVGIKKPQKKKSKKTQIIKSEEDDVETLDTKDIKEAQEKLNKQGITVGGKSYEEEFELEMKKAKEGKVKNTPWGSSFKAPPEILHGYDKKVLGNTMEEKLDMRSAMKSDKFCK